MWVVKVFCINIACTAVAMYESRVRSIPTCESVITLSITYNKLDRTDDGGYKVALRSNGDVDILQQWALSRLGISQNVFQL